MSKKKVMVGMSGGIDSSVTAYMLQNDGYEVEGVYLKLHNRTDGYHEKNLGYIKDVAKFLNIKYHILDLTDEFSKEVYDYFVDSYLTGTTPNPCVKCNKQIKFGAMLDFAKKHGADFLATGHYAKTDGKFFYEADDKTKDQS
ncbi:7-cyano-7-deazaguanine synthase, partial [Aliarcobacter butzleri]|nr:7-cyano-7-deazaguanine synthase [Aliarcobacter butzleri]